MFSNLTTITRDAPVSRRNAPRIRRSKHFAADLSNLVDFHDGAERCIKVGPLFDRAVPNSRHNQPAVNILFRGVGAPYMPWSVVAAVWASSRVLSEIA